MMTDTQQNDGPPFLADLADDAVMTGTILAKPLKGKDVISQVIRSIASCYVSQSMSGHAVDGSIETIEYDAELESGGTIHGSVIVTRRADGKVVAIDGRHSPQAAAAELAMVLRTKLGVSLTPDPRPH
jgi:LDH2 family malate/lactate/ureidoglycolate dehydrogenase